MEKDLTRLKLVIMPCREPVPLSCYKEYDAAYELWHKVWSKTLKDLDGVDRLYADDFMRQNFMSVIFDGDEAVSLMCYSEVNTKLKSRMNDSWFKPWPSSLIHKLNQEYCNDREGLLACWFSTHPDYRRSSSSGKTLDFNVSKAIFEIWSMLTLEGDYSIGYGVTRNNRGVGRYGEEIGAITVGETQAHNCDVNLIVLDKNIISKKMINYSIEAKTLWRNRVDFRKRYEQEKVNAKELFKTA